MAAIRFRQAAGLVLVSVLASLIGQAARGAEKNSGEPFFLVARREIQDPFFKESVVMMLPATNNSLIVGIIINKPTRITLGKLFPETPEFQNQMEPAYFGGPVEVQVPSVAFHSAAAPKHALRLYGDVYLTFDADLITTAFEKSRPAAMPRLFLGRAQWAPGQLENEIRRGSWYRVHAEGNLIFSSNPKGLWRALHDRAAPSKYIKYRMPPGRRPGNAAATSAHETSNLL